MPPPITVSVILIRVIILLWITGSSVIEMVNIVDEIGSRVT